MVGPDQPVAPDSPDAEELAALRAEVATLRAQADNRRRRTSAVTALRGGSAAVVTVVAAFALIASVVGLWAANTTLNTDRWVATVAPLPQDPRVSTAVADYATTQVFEVLDVDQRLRAVLPEQAAFVVAPLTGQVRDYVRKTVTNALRSDWFGTLWKEANRRAHQQVLAILRGTSTMVTAQGDRVSIDLLPLINQILRQLSATLPTLFGRKLTLPDLSSGEIPSGLRARVQDALGVPLPPNFAQFTVYDAGRLAAAQRAMVVARRALVALVAGTVLLLSLAFLVSPRRRRTALQLGLWLVVAAVAVTASLRTVRDQLLTQVPAGAYRDGVGAALTTVTGMLRVRGEQVIWFGVALAAVAYLAGPGRVPRWLRHGVAVSGRAVGRWMRSGTALLRAQGPTWLADHLDAVRILGVVSAVVAAMLLSSWTALAVIALVLVAFEVAVTLIARAAGHRATSVAGGVAPRGTILAAGTGQASATLPDAVHPEESPPEHPGPGER